MLESLNPAPFRKRETRIRRTPGPLGELALFVILILCVLCIGVIAVW
jgi:hypothetical protein